MAKRHAYVGSWGGLEITDVTQPMALKSGFYEAPGIIAGLAVAEDYAYVPTSDGMRVLNVSYPAVPVEIGAYLNRCGRLTISS